MLLWRPSWTKNMKSADTCCLASIVYWVAGLLSAFSPVSVPALTAGALLFSGLPQAVNAAASMPVTRSIRICFFFIGVPPSLGKALPQDFPAGDECRTIAALPVPILRSLA